MTVTAPPTVLDIVYPVRPGDHNPELRWSLRTLDTNLPHARVWIVGHKPAWLNNVGHIPGNDGPTGHANVYRNIQAACEHPDMPDQFIVFNDDMFITDPLTTIPTWYRGDLHDHMHLPGVRNGMSWWRDSLTTTYTCLQAHGIAHPVSYELHTPFVVDKQKMADTLRLFQYVTPDNPPQWRTLYGNLHHIGGSQHDDCKENTSGPINRPFHSTQDESWPNFMLHFASAFPTPSRYEVH